MYAYGEAPAADQLFYVSSFPANRDAGGSFSDWKVLSYLGVANYSFQDKYIFNLLGEMTDHLDLHLVTDLVISSLMELLGTFQMKISWQIIQL